MTQHHKTLDIITRACGEIEQALNKHLEATTNPQYINDIQKDLVSLNNIKHIVIAVKNDIDSDKVGASTELLMRIASNYFTNSIGRIPEKKLLCKEILKDLNDIHKNILYMTIKGKK
jgi:hypothetical protein